MIEKQRNSDTKSSTDDKHNPFEPCPKTCYRAFVCNR